MNVMPKFITLNDEKNTRIRGRFQPGVKHSTLVTGRCNRATTGVPGINSPGRWTHMQYRILQWNLKWKGDLISPTVEWTRKKMLWFPSKERMFYKTGTRGAERSYSFFALWLEKEANPSQRSGSCIPSKIKEDRMQTSPQTETFVV